MNLVVSFIVSSVASFVVSLTAHCFDLVTESYYLVSLIINSSLHVTDESSLSCS